MQGQQTLASDLLRGASFFGEATINTKEAGLDYSEGVRGFVTQA